VVFFPEAAVLLARQAVCMISGGEDSQEEEHQIRLPKAMGDVRGADGEERVGDEAEEDVMAHLGAFPAKVKMVEDAAEETLLLWAFQDPVSAKQNAFVSQGSLQLKLDACGQQLHIMQAPSSVVTLLHFNIRKRPSRPSLGNAFHSGSSFLEAEF
jgi:hypothetical protein